MDRLHDAPPDFRARVPGVVHGFGVVKAGPDSADIVGGKAAEPAVTVVGGRAGLARHRHLSVAEVGLVSGTVPGGCLKHFGNAARRVRVENVIGADRIVQHRQPGGVGDKRIGPRKIHPAVVGEHRIGLGHFPHRNAVGELSQRQRRVIPVSLHQIEAHAVGEILKGDGGGKLVDDLGGYGIFGADQSVPDRDDAVVIVRAVVAGIPPRPLQGDIGAVVDPGGFGDQAQVHGRTVRSKRFYGRACGPVRVGGVVPSEIPVFLAHAARDRKR